MTKREINETISAANSALALARWHVRYNEWEKALAQFDAANIAVLLAKGRTDVYANEQEMSS